MLSPDVWPNGPLGEGYSYYMYCKAGQDLVPKSRIVGLVTMAHGTVSPNYI